MVSGSFGNGNSVFGAGGYGKIRYCVPLRFEARPFIEARTGYSYSFSNNLGDMVYGVGLGIRLADKYSVGIYCSISSSGYTTQESYISGYERVNIAGKYYDRPIWKKRDITHSDTYYTPALLFSLDF